MAAELKITPVVDNSELEQSFERTEAVFTNLYTELKKNDFGEEFGKQMANAAKSAEDSESAIKDLFGAVSTQSREAKSLLEEMRSGIEGVQESLKELGEQEGMDEAVRENEELLQAIDSLTDELGDNQEAVDDAVESYNNLAESQRGVSDVSNDMVDALKGAYDLVLGKTQNLEGTIKKVYSAYTGFQKLMKDQGVDIANAAEKMGLLNKASLALGKALVKAGLSANAARLALSAMSAVPVVAAITAIIVVLRRLVKHHQEAKAAAEEAARAQEEFYSEVSKGAAPNIVKFQELSDTWKSLSTDMAKTEFLEKSKSAFDALGISVNTLQEAQDVLVNNADSYIQAQMKMAQADVYRARVRTQTEELLNLQQQLETTPEGKKTWTEVEESYIDDMGNRVYEKVKRKVDQREALQSQIESKTKDILDSQKRVYELVQEGNVLLDHNGEYGVWLNPEKELKTPKPTSSRGTRDNADPEKRLKQILSSIKSKSLAQAFQDMMSADSIIHEYLNQPIDTEEVEEAYTSLIASYGTYEEKRLEIHRKYLGKINAADGRERELYQKAMDEELRQLDDAEGPMVALYERAVSLSEIFIQMGDSLEDLGGTIGEIGKGIGALGKSAKDVVEVYRLAKEGQEFDKPTAILGVISGVVDIAAMVGKQIKENKEAQEDWNRVIEQSVHEMTMLSLEALDYKQQNIFGVENPYKAAIDGAKQYSEAMKALQEQITKLNNGKVQTGTRKAINWANVGKGAAIGASAGAIAGAGIFSGLTTLGGAAIGAITGLVAGLFSTKVEPVFENLTAKYGQIVNENLELNPQLLADYNKLDDATKQLVDNWEDIKSKAQEAEEQMHETFTNLAGDIGGQLSDSLVSAFKNGKLNSAIDDFHDKMNDTIEDIIEQMIFSNVFSEMFDNLQKDMEDSFAAAGDMNIVDDLMRFEEAYKSGLEEYGKQMEEAKAYLRDAGYDEAFKSDEQRTASSKSPLGASQDSVDESNARLTAIQSEVYLINETLAGFQANYERLIANTAAMIEHTQGIHVDTTELKGMVSEMRELSRSVSRNVSQMTDKGVKML